jgi:Diadenosine tetraphosphate (Ap4A) hydrolase and other HIT family hydrolases
MISGCKICDGEFPQGYVVWQDDCWMIRHSQETNILGYFVLQSKRHFLDLSEGTIEECASYGHVLSHLMKALRQVLDCERIYTFSLAEAVPHFHVHVIPRAVSFPRAYKGRGIMSYPVEPAASPPLVEQVCTRVQSSFKKANIDTGARNLS